MVVCSALAGRIIDATSKTHSVCVLWGNFYASGCRAKGNRVIAAFLTLHIRRSCGEFKFCNTMPDGTSVVT